MGSIFSSKHTFSSLATPVKEAGRMGRTLKSRKRALDAKIERKISAKHREKQQIYKQEEKERKAKEKERKKKEKLVKKEDKKYDWDADKKELAQSKNKPKYNKWGDRIA